MATKITIFDIRQIPSSDPNRVGLMDKLVMYQLDPMRRYVIKMPSEDFNEEKMMAAIKKDMEERAQYTGKEYEIA